MNSNRLASPIQDIRPHYTVVVIGSGYGGAITASRLSRAGQSVCVLERGRERQPGEFPDTTPEALEEMHMDLPAGHMGSRTGLFDLHCNPDMNVLVGCGLGGTSLINANVSIRAEARVFEDPRWPKALRDEKQEGINSGYKLAEDMLKPRPYPDSWPKLKKLEAMKTSAEAMGQKFYRTSINVTFEDGVNEAGVFQKACNNCGDCCSGCNVGAKNTVLMNYLPDARRHGAEIFCETSVRYLERGANGKWLVHFQVLDTGREKFDAPLLTVSADLVVLAAGSLGSTEILLRSKAKGLPVSDRLGQGFSGNGDVLGFAYNNEMAIDGVGLGTRPPSESGPVGPTITGIIDIRNQEKLEDDIIIQEGAVPGALAPILPAMLSTTSELMGTNTAPGQAADQEMRKLDSAVRGAYHGAVKHTQTFLVMGHEGQGSNGTMKLEEDRLRIDWPGVGSRPIFEKVDKRLVQTTQALRGIYTRAPLWNELLGKDLITVHPLGGCNMADSAEQGVVNHENKVFSSTTGEQTHEGLYVCDGAVIPTSLGVNPLLTISALSERCSLRISAERGWTIDYSKKGPIPVDPRQRKPGIRFTEKMKGFFSPAQDENYTAAATRGELLGSPFEFTLTIISEDVEKMMKAPDHAARMVGTVKAPKLSDKPLTATQGVFNLFVQDPNAADTRLMKYQMLLTADDGRTFFFKGFKVIKERPIEEMWHDTTTLFITVYEGQDESGAVVGRGVLKIAPEDFMRQLTTMDVFNAKNAGQRLELSLEFGRYFTGILYDYYGGMLGQLDYIDPNAPPRKRRPLRAPAPQLFGFKTPDGLDLLLSRYQAGSKGPVLLAHGLGVSSRIFSTDTIDTNLLEYLCAHGYDVWLLDYRSSTLLPASTTQYTADDVATKDWPAAVARVRELTGAANIQVVAHCYGSTTFTMAMLAGLQGVRSAVCSQISTHVVTPPLVSIKSGLHLPQLLKRMGIQSLTTNAVQGEGPLERIYDRLLAAYPVGKDELCDSAVCHRISFLYSLLYRHEQLNAMTHQYMHELFGEATIAAFEGLAIMVNKRRVVDANGNDVYMPHLKRMAIPIRFIHGARNQCFLPESTEKTVQALSKVNGSALYSRVLIPEYGHIDCIFGKNAARDVYGYILEHLDQTQAPGKKQGEPAVAAAKKPVAA
ncbi:alpha/beta fold hydrolase [Archangium violaceum]|uniref:alpha/beta fold hydrolase n=1 Tax=Archangium violaceum TaxID=83451 RepID=UPI002B2E7A31|nr:alpha/beta fold hydrolase [Archangium gephyra]